MCPPRPRGSMDSELGGDLWYNYGKGNQSMVVYEGVNANGDLHTIYLQDGT